MQQVLCFKCDEQEYAVGIGYVREIIRLVAITPIPDAPASVLGVINLRGTVIPIVDMRIKMGMRRNVLELNTPIMVVSFGLKSIGLIVDQVTEVAMISKDHMQAIPSTLEHLSYLSGVAKVDNRLIHCVDLDEMVKADEACIERRGADRPWSESAVESEKALASQVVDSA